MKTEQSHKTPAPQSQTSKAATPNPLQKAAKWTRLLNVSQERGSGINQVAVLSAN